MREPRLRRGNVQPVLQQEIFGRRVTGSGQAAAATTEGNWIPLVDGSEPPNFITDGAGTLITVWYTP